jgi:hypothetical protein
MWMQKGAWCMLFVGLVVRVRSTHSTADDSSGINSINNIPELSKFTQQQTQLYELIATFHPLWYD